MWHLSDVADSETEEIPERQFGKVYTLPLDLRGWVFPTKVRNGKNGIGRKHHCHLHGYREEWGGERKYVGLWVSGSTPPSRTLRRQLNPLNLTLRTYYSACCEPEFSMAIPEHRQGCNGKKKSKGMRKVIWSGMKEASHVS